MAMYWARACSGRLQVASSASCHARLARKAKGKGSAWAQTDMFARHVSLFPYQPPPPTKRVLYEGRIKLLGAADALCRVQIVCLWSSVDKTVTVEEVLVGGATGDDVHAYTQLMQNGLERVDYTMSYTPHVNSALLLTGLPTGWVR